METGNFYSNTSHNRDDGGLMNDQCCQPFGGSGYKALQALQQYWNLLLWRRRDSGRPSLNPSLVPLRSAFDPMKIHRHLPDIYIAERKSDAVLTVRVAGTAIDEAAGFSMQGANYFDVCLPQEREFFIAVTGAMLKQPCGMKLTRRVTLKSGQVFKYSAMCFPFADRDGVPRYIVGMAKIAADASRSHFETSSTLRSEISDFSYIDIGAGLPAKPMLLV